MTCLIRQMIATAALFLGCCPLAVQAQGVESSPTGVDDLAPELSGSHPRPPSGWLGVLLGEPDGEAEAVNITEVLRKSPAKRSGLRSGDRILAIDGRKVGSPAAVQKIVDAYQPGHKATIKIQRGDQTKTVSVSLGKAPRPQKLLGDQFVGHPAPPIAGTRVPPEESAVGLDAFGGRPLVIDFWATWCGPCRPLSRKLARLHRQFGQQVGFIGLTSETKTAVTRYLADHSHGFSVATTTDAVLESYLVESYPTVFVVDANGSVAGVFVGLGHSRDVADLLDKLTATDTSGAPNSPSSERPTTAAPQ